MGTEFHRVIVDKLGIDVVTHDPVIILTDAATGQVLPLVIGIFEATSIAFALEHHETPRPLSHDIIKDVIEQLDAELTRVEIHSVINDTYLCNLVLKTRDSTEIEIDCRPSDAIAVALRTDTEIYIAAELMERNGIQGHFTASSTQSDETDDGEHINHLTLAQTGNSQDEEAMEEKENEVDEFLDNFDCSSMLLDEDEDEDEDDEDDSSDDVKDDK